MGPLLLRARLRAPEQTAEFLAEEVQPVLDRYADQLGVDVEIKV